VEFLKEPFEGPFEAQGKQGRRGRAGIRSPSHNYIITVGYVLSSYLLSKYFVLKGIGRGVGALKRGILERLRIQSLWIERITKEWGNEARK